MSDVPPPVPTPPAPPDPKWWQRSAFLAWVTNTISTAMVLIGALVALAQADAWDAKTVRLTLIVSGASVVKDLLGAIKEMIRPPVEPKT